MGRKGKKMKFHAKDIVVNGLDLRKHLKRMKKQMKSIKRRHKKCLPNEIIVEFGVLPYGDPTCVTITSDVGIKNVALLCANCTQYKITDFNNDMEDGPLTVTICTGDLECNNGDVDDIPSCEECIGEDIIGVWVRSGCNNSGEGPSYGEFFPNPNIDSNIIDDCLELTQTNSSKSSS